MNEINEDDVRTTYKLLNHENETEIRLIDPNKINPPLSFFVSDEDSFVKICKEYNGKYNIYAGINERIKNGTVGKDVISVKTVVIDIDPKRKKNTASDDKELDSSHTVACQIEYDILQMGFEQPKKAMSGNGYQLWFAIPKIAIDDDFRNIIESKMKIFNRWFIERYNNSVVNIDNIGDLPRVIKVIGTLSIKGDDIEERPHRISHWIREKNCRTEDPKLREFIMKLEEEMKKIVREVKFDDIGDEKFSDMLKNDEKLRDLMNGNWEKYYPGKSRSEAESGLVTKLISYGVPKHQIFSIMDTCKIGKWLEKPNAYKERTYEKSLEYYKTVDSKQENIVKWCNENITVLYTIGFKPSLDEVEVLVGSSIKIPRCRLNLRDNMIKREKFQKKLEEFDQNIDKNAVIEIVKSIISNVECVENVGCVDYTGGKDSPIFFHSYAPVSLDDDDFVYIHPALDFVKDKMYVGINLTAKDQEGNVDLMPFIVKNNDLISVPQLPEHSIKLLKPPMVYKKFFIYTPPNTSTSPTLPTHSTQKLADCYQRIKKELDTYIEFSDPTSSTLIAVWILGTYMFKVFNAYPYVSLLGFKGTGKTRVMEISSYMSFNGTTSVGISPSALFRGTDLLSWTLFFDEAELFKSGDKRSKRAEELMPLILAGYKKGGLVPRVGSKESGFKLEFFNTYCPKMFASTEEMDWILESRCIQVVMRPAEKGGAGEREPDEFNQKWEDLRTSILYACLHEWNSIKSQYTGLINDTTLTNRDYELSKPLLSIARYISEDIYNEIKKYMEQTTSEKTGDNLERSEFYILKALVALDRWDDLLDAHTILDKTNELKGGFKPDWMNSIWLGRNLKKLNFNFEKPRSGRGFNYIFKKEDVYNACRRFGIDADTLNKEFRPESFESKDFEKQKILGDDTY